MQANAAQPYPAPDGASVHYERHRPEQTTLYRLVQQHAATYFEQASGRSRRRPAAVCEGRVRRALEQLCRYITRPALANERVQTNAAGRVVLKLKTPWRDGTTHLVMSPLEFMQQRLAALVPRPRLHLIRFHGVLAPNAELRAQVVPQDPEPPAQAAPAAEWAGQRKQAHQQGQGAQAETAAGQQRIGGGLRGGHGRRFDLASSAFRCTALSRPSANWATYAGSA